MSGAFDLVDWLRNDALPLWARIGIDPANDLFIERLDLGGRPLPDTPRRAMVQARQIFVFANAHERGWCDGAALAQRAGDAMCRLYRSDDLPGWAFAVSRDGTIVDGRRDFYAQAFALLALATLARLTGDASWLSLADETLAFLDEAMGALPAGSYAESWPRKGGPRRQNPHMHLLEALLALHEVESGRGYLDRADRMVAMLQSHFLHGPSGVLVEDYDDDMRPFTAPTFAFEPGHHCEWAWLLAKHAALSERSSQVCLAQRLWASALRYGRTSDHTIYDEVTSDGAVTRRTTRLWPYTECCRAATLDLGLIPGAPNAAEIAADLNERFLAPAPQGCWLDHLDAEGAPLSTFIPASSLYHIVGAALAIDASPSKMT